MATWRVRYNQVVPVCLVFKLLLQDQGHGSFQRCEPLTSNTAQAHSQWRRVCRPGLWSGPRGGEVRADVMTATLSTGKGVYYNFVCVAVCCLHFAACCQTHNGRVSAESVAHITISRGIYCCHCCDHCIWRNFTTASRIITAWFTSESKIWNN